MGNCTSKGIARLERPAAVLALALCLSLALLQGPAAASQTVKLSASFEPNRPGALTTITFGFDISSPPGQVPSPLRGLDLHLPAGIGLARNALGTAICDPYFLYAYGPNACPPNSHVGYGTALAEVPYGPAIIQEYTAIYAYRGRSEGEHLTMLFFAEGWTPVFADLVFPGQLLEDTPPYSGRIDTQVPIVESLPGGPNVSVVKFQSTFGPKHLTYYRTIHGRRTPFTPRGAIVPVTCPPGGYPFAADFNFEDGTALTVHTSVPCATSAKSLPRRGHHRAARR